MVVAATHLQLTKPSPVIAALQSTYPFQRFKPPLTPQGGLLLDLVSSPGLQFNFQSILTASMEMIRLPQESSNNDCFVGWILLLNLAISALQRAGRWMVPEERCGG